MKKIILFLASVFLFYSCKKDENSSARESLSTKSFKVRVAHNGSPQAGAIVMCMFSDTEDAIFRCNQNGIVSIPITQKIEMIAALAPNLSSIVEKPDINQKEYEMELEVVSLFSANKKSSAKYIGTFGVYDTDANGDVRFMYQGTFIDYDCINNLPWLGSSPDPNDWDGWDLDDFLPSEGKKLLVPRRYQTYHSTVYGYSISDALILRANI